MLWSQSEHLFTQARQVIPGGVNSPARAFGGVGGHPLYITRGKGAYIWDADGHCYIDYIGSWGPLILGHAEPAVVVALQEAVAWGTSYGAPTELETQLAQTIVEALPSVEMVRFVNSGTEATMSALRLARAFTGRNKIIKFAGCYHGHADLLLVQAGSGVATLGLPDSPGVPPGATQDTLSLPYNDLDAVVAAFSANPREIAAVIVEPVAGNMGVVPPEEGFLAGLRRLCDQDGALLIFDEVITGFRVTYGGTQTLYNARPDLTCLGKIIGGGLPVGAYGGRREIMEWIAPRGPVYQAGTLSGNPLAMTAGLETLRQLQEPAVYQQLETRSARLMEGIESAACQARIPVQQNRVGSMQCTFFTSEPVTNYSTAKQADTIRYAAFFWGMLDRGVYLPPSQFETTFISLAHGEEEIETTIVAAREVLESMA